MPFPWQQQNDMRGGKEPHLLRELSWFQPCDASWLSQAPGHLWVGDAEFFCAEGWQERSIRFRLKCLRRVEDGDFCVQRWNLSVRGTAILGSKMRSPLLFPFNLESFILMMLNILLFLFYVILRFLPECYELNCATPQNPYVEVLTPSTSECDCILERRSLNEAIKLKLGY